uniref:DUF2007 domain-containing protein n=1 Tax=candidate division WOR-3 bacterium TaxID=2052148 RepID=A0A7V3UZ36_UNCW3
MALKQVYKAENELMANTIKDLLESNGIPALVHSFQIPAYDGIAQVMRPVWGEVLVEEENLNAAQELIQGFLSGEPGNEPEADNFEEDGNR